MSGLLLCQRHEIFHHLIAGGRRCSGLLWHGISCPPPSARRRAHVMIAACLAIAMEPTIARAETEPVPGMGHCSAYANRAIRQMYIAAGFGRRDFAR